MKNPMSSDEFISRCTRAHNGKYDYSKTIFTMCKNSIVVTCPVHGDITQNAGVHMRGHGCKKCAMEFIALNQTYCKDDIIRIGKEVWGDLFDYSEIEYTYAKNKCKIKCNTCGEFFYQRIGPHLNKRQNGCPNCKNNRGFRKSQWINFCNKKKCIEPTVYIIRAFNETEAFVKIGITSTTIFDRFNSFRRFPYEYEVIKTISGSPAFVFDKEKELHKLLDKFKTVPLLWFDGFTECFSIDTLPLIDHLT